jgi:hypothetical protein
MAVPRSIGVRAPVSQGPYPDNSRNEQNKQEQGRQDESVPITLLKARETDQVMDGSQLLKGNIEN